MQPSITGHSSQVTLLTASVPSEVSSKANGINLTLEKQLALYLGWEELFLGVNT